MPGFLRFRAREVARLERDVSDKIALYLLQNEALSPEVARRCDVQAASVAGMTGGGRAVAASAGVISSLGIGGVRISRVRVAVAEFLEGLGRAVGVALDGIVGTNVLRRFRLTIDYPAAILRLV